MEDSAPVRLYPSQKAYRRDPDGFLLRLNARATTLFESGYLVYPAREPHTFIVTQASGPNAPRYEVHATTQTCTCPFYTQQIAGEYLGEDTTLVPCKHVLGLSALVRKNRRWLYQTGQVRAFCTLSIHWMKHLSALRRERIQEAQEQEAASAVTINHYRPSPTPVSPMSLQGYRSCGAGFHSSGKENKQWRR